jgi:hypothetical protein
MLSLLLPVKSNKKVFLYSFKKIKIEIKEDNPAKIAFDDLVGLSSFNHDKVESRINLELKEKRINLPLLTISNKSLLAMQKVNVDFKTNSSMKQSAPEFKFDIVSEEIKPNLNRAQKIRLEQVSKLGMDEEINKILNSDDLYEAKVNTEEFEAAIYRANAKILEPQAITQNTLDSQKVDFNQDQNKKKYNVEPEKKFDKSFFDNLEKAYREKNVATRVEPNKTIFFGRAVYEDRAVQNAVVQMDEANSKVVYLNETFQPDFELRSTASHGYFAFFDVPAGLQTIRWEKGSLLAGYENLLAEQDKTTEFQIEGDLSKRQSIYSFDAFTKERSSMTCFFQGTQEEVIISGGVTTRLYTPNLNQNFSHCRNEESPFLSVNHIHTKLSNDLYLPQISRQWLLSFDKSYSLFTTLIGFVPNSLDYEVYLNGELVNKISYFDNSGNKVDGPIQGGGFYIARNFDKVLKIEVRDKLSEKRISILLPSEEGIPFIHVFDF